MIDRVVVVGGGDGDGELLKGAQGFVVNTAVPLVHGCVLRVLCCAERKDSGIDDKSKFCTPQCTVAKSNRTILLGN